MDLKKKPADEKHHWHSAETRPAKWFAFRSLHFLRILAFWHLPCKISSVIQSVACRLPYFGYSILTSMGECAGCTFVQGARYRQFSPGRLLLLWTSLREQPAPPFSYFSQFSFCRRISARANRFVLYPTPGGPFHERFFGRVMRIYTARHFAAQPFSIV